MKNANPRTVCFLSCDVCSFVTKVRQNSLFRWSRLSSARRLFREQTWRTVIAHKGLENLKTASEIPMRQSAALDMSSDVRIGVLLMADTLRLSLPDGERPKNGDTLTTTEHTCALASGWRHQHSDIRMQTFLCIHSLSFKHHNADLSNVDVWAKTIGTHTHNCLGF